MDSAWDLVESVIDGKSTDGNVSGDLENALKLLHEEDLLEAIEEKIYSNITASITKDIIPLLHSHCSFPNLVSTTFLHAQQYDTLLRPTLDFLNQHGQPCSLLKIYHTSLELSNHTGLSHLAKEFYTHAQSMWTSLYETHKNKDWETGAGVCTQSRCKCTEVHSEIVSTRQYIKKLGIFGGLVEETLFQVIRSVIQEKVTVTCTGVFDRSVIQELLSWLNEDLMRWLLLAAPDIQSDMIASEHLLYYMYDQLVRLRLGELLHMIIDYPESKVSFEDLGAALPHTNLRTELINSLKQVYESRILHPGVNTTDILTTYIQSIQALRVLDPSCVLLEVVTAPVRQYLRSRDDTVRCIVSNLIDDSCDVLADELTRVVCEEDIADDDHIEHGWQEWQPDPIDADPEVSSKIRRSTDTINMLVNIYGSKELFIKEYWNLLADRLLSNLSYTTLWEIRHLELLKIRFGESDLHMCEVMLKDVADSKRLNTWINNEIQKSPVDQQIPFQLNAMILSGKYWPSFKEDTISLPAEMQAALDKYTKSYETTKVNRTIKWKPHIGQVDIDIEMDSGQMLTFKTSPMNVAIIMAFQEQDVYSLEELTDKVKSSASNVRKRITYWVSHSVLREVSADVYSLNKEQPAASAAPEFVEDDIESVMASAEEQKEEELQMLWPYVNGMLTNIESQSLERIHAMLKMFANTECSITELEAFLSRKIREGKLISAAGVYKLANSLSDVSQQ